MRHRTRHRSKPVFTTQKPNAPKQFMDSWHVFWLVACSGRRRIRISHADTGATYVLIEIFGWSLMGIVVGIVTGSVMLGLLRMAPERGGKIKSSDRNCEGA